jgi:hypothetical protein
VQEQVVIADLDTGNVDAAERGLQPLTARFPKSNRVGAPPPALFPLCLWLLTASAQPR